jgi:hypothetical protein
MPYNVPIESRNQPQESYIMNREYKMVNSIDDGAAVVAKDFVSKFRSKKPALSDDAIGKCAIEMSKKAALSDDAIAEVGSQIVKKARIQKPAVAKKSRPASKKSQARELFVAGHTAAEVASILEITYANAHYHLRAFRKAGGDIGQPAPAGSRIGHASRY